MDEQTESSSVHADHRPDRRVIELEAALGSNWSDDDDDPSVGIDVGLLIEQTMKEYDEGDPYLPLYQEMIHDEHSDTE